MAAVTDLDRAVASLALEHNLIEPQVALDILRSCAGSEKRLMDRLLVEVTEIALLSTIAAELRLVFCDLFGPNPPYRTDDELLRRADAELLKQYSALPMVDRDGKVVVAIANPTDLDLRNYLQGRFPQMSLVLSPRGQIQAKLSMSRSGFSKQLEGLDELDPVPAAAPTTIAAPAGPKNPLVAWTDSVFEAALSQGASDLHFAFNADGTMLLRFRTDGVLRQQPAGLRGREMEVMGILMNKAGLDAANYRDPQDGQFSFQAAGRVIDVRVSMLPQVNGPSIVCRLLDSQNIRRRLVDMGFAADQITQMRNASRTSHGMIMVCGPTGSGKTTTLYAVMREIASVERNIVTIEDPVEYRLPLVNQTQVRNTGERPLTFAKALRATLRQDPDVILVGEIRDAETSKTALDAAITGHLVLSTVHARDAIGIYTRLVEMGSPAYLVAEAVTLAVAQRLARKLHDCAKMDTPNARDEMMFARLGLDKPTQVLRATGCAGCNGSGYRGRTALVEVFEPSPTFKTMIAESAIAEDLVAQARADGFRPMSIHAAQLVMSGETSIDEVARVLEVSA